MKRIIAIVTVILSFSFIGGCKTVVKADNNAEIQMEENDTYVPWWATTGTTITIKE